MTRHNSLQARFAIMSAYEPIAQALKTDQITFQESQAAYREWLARSSWPASSSITQTTQKVRALLERSASTPISRRPLVTSQERFSMDKITRLVDSPSPFASLETWERHLQDLKAMPDNVRDKETMILLAEQMIERKRLEAE
jgi:hypothetical protein